MPDGPHQQPEGRQRLSLAEPHESFLIQPVLMHRQMVEAGVDVLLDGRPVTFRVRAAGDALGDVLLADRLRGLLDVAW